MGFYFNNRFIDNSFIRNTLRNSNKSPISIPETSDESLTGNEALLSKLGRSVKKYDTSSLVDKLSTYITDSASADVISAIMNMSDMTIMTIVYLLNDPNSKFTYSNLEYFLSIRNEKDRSEYLLGFLEDEPPINIFDPLNSVVKQMDSRVRNAYEVYNRDNLFRTVDLKNVPYAQTVHSGNHYWRVALNPRVYSRLVENYPWNRQILSALDNNDKNIRKLLVDSSLSGKNFNNLKNAIYGGPIAATISAIKFLSEKTAAEKIDNILTDDFCKYYTASSVGVDLSTVFRSALLDTLSVVADEQFSQRMINSTNKYTTIDSKKLEEITTKWYSKDISLAIKSMDAANNIWTSKFESDPDSPFNGTIRDYLNLYGDKSNTLYDLYQFIGYKSGIDIDDAAISVSYESTPIQLNSDLNVICGYDANNDVTNLISNACNYKSSIIHNETRSWGSIGRENLELDAVGFYCNLIMSFALISSTDKTELKDKYDKISKDLDRIKKGKLNMDDGKHSSLITNIQSFLQSAHSKVKNITKWYTRSNNEVNYVDIINQDLTIKASFADRLKTGLNKLNNTLSIASVIFLSPEFPDNTKPKDATKVNINNTLKAYMGGINWEVWELIIYIKSIREALDKKPSVGIWMPGYLLVKIQNGSAYPAAGAFIKGGTSIDSVKTNTPISNNNIDALKEIDILIDDSERIVNFGMFSYSLFKDTIDIIINHITAENPDINVLSIDNVANIQSSLTNIITNLTTEDYLRKLLNLDEFKNLYKRDNKGVVAAHKFVFDVVVQILINYCNYLNTNSDNNLENIFDLSGNSNLFDTYKKIFKLRHIFNNASDVYSKIINSDVYAALLDPFGTNTILDGIYRYLEEDNPNKHATAKSNILRMKVNNI